MTQTESPRVSEQELQAYHRDGLHIARGLFSPEKVEALKDRFQKMADAGEPVTGPRKEFAWQPNWEKYEKGDILGRYPRVMMPHYYCDLARNSMIDPGIGSVLRQLLDEEPVAVQSMYYFKPCGAKGQALHQDNFYLQVAPTTCIAAWVAIDPSTPENGGLYVVPGTHTLGVLCPEEADIDKSFTNHHVKPPESQQPVPTHLHPGDVLFFNGSLIHGSDPNNHPSLWRRSFICHYMPRSSVEVGKGYLPAVAFDGSVLEDRYRGTEGLPCGVEWERKRSATQGG